jgi:hypothetical protein
MIVSFDSADGYLAAVLCISALSLLIAVLADGIQPAGSAAHRRLFPGKTGQPVATERRG